MLRICSLFILLMLPLVALADPSGVVRVIDGDTWDVGGARVRLFGIDTPEPDQTCERGGELLRCGSQPCVRRDWGCMVWGAAERR